MGAVRPKPKDPFIRACASSGLSMAQTGRLMGWTRGQVAGRASKIGVTFSGEPFIGGGCDRKAALRGWETRRARGWTPAPMVHRVNHLG